MQVQVRRTKRATLGAVINLLLMSGAGVVLIGNEMVSAAPSGAGIAFGLVFLLWAMLILTGLLRPVLIALDADGIALRRVFGNTRFAWDELEWIDFESSPRVGMVAATVGGRQRFAGVSLRPAEPGDLAAALAAIRDRRPDLPTRNPARAAPQEAA